MQTRPAQHKHIGDQNNERAAVGILLFLADAKDSGKLGGSRRERRPEYSDEDDAGYSVAARRQQDDRPLHFG